ncbi:MAG TPA: DUF2309 domain-containing protein [Lacunisphaera sp.]
MPARALAPSPVNQNPASDLPAALERALGRIPPLWPLGHFVAVNPFVGLVDQPFAAACQLLQLTTGAAPLQSPAEYRWAFKEGLIDASDLETVAQDGWTPQTLIQALDLACAEPSSGPLPTVADWLDRSRPKAHWSAFVTDEISKWCSVRFDENQTTWNSPWKGAELYAGWREAAIHDRNPEAFGLVGFRAFVASLPADANAALVRCLSIVAPSLVAPEDFLHRQLVTIAGWAGYVQYLVREDALRGQQNYRLKELLAIRLAYDAALFQAFLPTPAHRREWDQATRIEGNSAQLEALARWQSAFEIGYQRRLARALATSETTESTTRPVAQAVFCIDVRSEVFRRHLEAALPGTQTIGFAGFFGFPLAHRSAGSAVASARCPVLLVPPVNTCEPLSPNEAERTEANRAEAGAWKAFQNSAASCFSFVETAGLAFGAALGRPRKKPVSCARVKPAFESASLETRARLATGALKNMGLVRNFARLVLICGHGSQSANNPYASSLDCGACGGHAGDVNAQLAAETLNAPDVRAVLAKQGLVIPDDTVFIAGLHNTTTDDVRLLNVETVPETHVACLNALRDALARAGAGARRERAASLGLGELPHDEIDAAVRHRAADIAEVRPEWGLANNAAFIAAPRRRTAHLQLDGRVFLHDYDSESDRESELLTLILSAPVVVASWINLQYYASRIDPARYGSGNKVLHNVVGGIGVVEGNGGDLKVGLPLQSIHNGHRYIHEPRRLAVYIEAPASKIGAVLAKNPAVKQLFDHEWLHLWAITPGGCLRYCRGTWNSCPPLPGEPVAAGL